MRELNNNEIANVSGGTFCFLGGLLKGLLSFKKSYNTCAPAPRPHCEPKRRHGC